MKKLFSLMAAALVVSTSAFAENHVQFLGIDLAGSRQEFGEKLLAIPGVQFVEATESCDTYTGSYSGYDGAEFYVFLNASGVVNNVDVYLPEVESWMQLKRQYIATVAEYQDKEGYTLIEHSEEFEGFYNGGDGRELEAVEQGICNYYSTFTCSEGYVSISISKYKQLKLVFWDYESSNVVAESLRVMGIDLVGSIDKLAQRFVEERGFTIDEESSTEGLLYTLRGSFTGLQNCELYITADDNGDCNLVLIYLPEQTQWNRIKEQYLLYKQNYSQKYTLQEENAYFSGGYYEGDGCEMTAIAENECNYWSNYSAPGGTIRLYISTYKQVCIVYDPE